MVCLEGMTISQDLSGRELGQLLRQGRERQGLHGQLGARLGLAEEPWLLEQLP